MTTRIDRVKLAGILRGKDMRQTELADISGVTRATIGNIMAGRSCSTETAQKVADALQIPVEDITAIRREA